MKTLFRFLILAVLAVSFCFIPTAKGATVITATITVTNIAQVGTNWVVNGNTRTWTNNTAASPQSFIQTTNSIAATASNLYQHITRFPYLAPNLTVQRTSPTNIVLRGTSLTVTTNNYFQVSYATNTGTNLSVVQVPFENVVGETNRTNNAHWLVDAFNRFVYTNALATNASVLTNALIKGAQPYQEVLGPIGFRGRTAVNSNFFATNGFTANLTNINPVLSNGVNFGNAFRSEGSGGNSLQLGSNSQATAARAVSVGNGAASSAADGFAAGTLATNSGANGTAVGNLSLVTGQSGAAYGFGATSTNLGTAVGTVAIAGSQATAVGRAAEATGESSGAFGDSAVASAYGSGAFMGGATAILSFGYGGVASHSNSVAMGAPDHLGNTTTTTATNQIVFGTANHRVLAPGLYESPKQTNSQFAGTNVARGSWSYPAFALTTLAAGNNISVPAGTNKYIRCGAGPVSAPTVCGIIGAATSGGLDGQELHLFNDTGFTLTLGVNTVDPVPANRINTPSGGDVSIADQSWAFLTYDGTDARWKLNTTYPIQASATNALGSLSTNGTLVTAAWTNLNLIYGNGIDARTTNTSGDVSISLRSKHYRLFSLISNVTVTNTTSPTSLITNALDLPQIIPAGTLSTGAVIRIRVAGIITSVSATACETGLRFNNGTLIATNMQALSTSLVNDRWGIECDATIRTTGASGTIMGNGLVFSQTISGAGQAASGRRMNMGLLNDTATIDTTVDQVIDLYFDPGATTHGLTITEAIVEIFLK